MIYEVVETIFASNGMIFGSLFALLLLEKLAIRVSLMAKQDRFWQFTCLYQLAHFDGIKHKGTLESGK